MKSGNLDIGTSGNPKTKITAKTLRSGGDQTGGESGDRDVGTSGHLKTTDHPITRLRNAWNVLRAALHEIFDETAYRRFLSRTGLAHSAASYRAFQGEREAAACTRPRCC